MQGYDNKQFTASNFKAVTEEAWRDKRNWYKNRIEEYMRRHLQYQIRAAAEKGHNELLIDVSAICRWIKNGIPDSVVYDTKTHYCREYDNCIDDAIHKRFCDYIEKAGFSIGCVDFISKQLYIRW